MRIHGYLDMVIHVACLVEWIVRAIFLFGWIDGDSHADYVIRDPLIIYLFIVKNNHIRSYFEDLIKTDTMM